MPWWLCNLQWIEGLQKALRFHVGPMTLGKAGIPGFVPNLAVSGKLCPLAMPPYPTVDPAAASALQGRLAAAFDGAVPQPSFGESSAVCLLLARCQMFL
jgi:hypothetical protein